MALPILSQKPGKTLPPRLAADARGERKPSPSSSTVPTSASRVPRIHRRHSPSSPNSDMSLYLPNTASKRHAIALPSPDAANISSSSPSSASQTPSRTNSRIPRASAKTIRPIATAKHLSKPLPPPPAAQVQTEGPRPANIKLLDASLQPLRNASGGIWPSISPEKLSSLRQDLLSGSAHESVAKAKNPLKPASTIAPSDPTARRSSSHELSRQVNASDSGLPHSVSAPIFFGLSRSNSCGRGTLDFDDIARRFNDDLGRGLSTRNRGGDEDDGFDVFASDGENFATKGKSCSNSSTIFEKIISNAMREQGDTTYLSLPPEQKDVVTTAPKTPYNSECENSEISVSPLRIRKTSSSLSADQSCNITAHRPCSTQPSSRRRDRSPHPNILLTDWTGSPESKKSANSRSHSSLLRIEEDSIADSPYKGSTEGGAPEMMLKDNTPLLCHGNDSCQASFSSLNEAMCTTAVEASAKQIQGPRGIGDIHPSIRKSIRSIPSLAFIKRRLTAGQLKNANLREGNMESNDVAEDTSTNRMFLKPIGSKSSPIKKEFGTKRLRSLFQKDFKRRSCQPVKEVRCDSRPKSPYGRRASTSPKTANRFSKHSFKSHATANRPSVTRRPTSQSAKSGSPKGASPRKKEHTLGRSVNSLSGKRARDLENARAVVNQFVESLAKETSGDSSLGGDPVMTGKIEFVRTLQSLLEGVESVTFNTEDALRAARHAEMSYNWTYKTFRDAVDVATGLAL